jgi:hypothetical protein
LNRERGGSAEEVFSGNFKEVNETMTDILLSNSKQLAKLGKDTAKLAEDAKEMLVEMAKGLGEGSTYARAFEGIGGLPSKAESGAKITLALSNTEVMGILFEGMGSKLYDAKNDPKGTAYGLANLVVSLDVYQTGFKQENMYYGAGIIVGGVLLDTGGRALKLLGTGADVAKAGKLMISMPNPILERTILDKTTSLAHPNLKDKINITTALGNTVTVNKAAYNTGVELLAMGKEVRVIGSFPSYLHLSEALGTKAFNLPTSVWKSNTVLKTNEANFRFIERGAAKNSIFILSDPTKSSTKYGSGLKNEINWLENFFNYQKDIDGIKYTK